MILDHLKNYRDLYGITLVWLLLGAALPKLLAAGVVVVSYLLILRTRDLSKIFFSFLTILIFSDSRSRVFAFAETAKIGIVLLLLCFIIINWEEFKNVPNKVFTFFLPFLFFAVTASIWSENNLVSIQKSLSYSIVFFIVPLLFVRSNDENSSFKRDLIVYFFLVLTAGLLVHLVLPNFTTLVGRYRGLLGNPNGLGIFLTVMFSIVYLIRNKIGKAFEEDGFRYMFYLVFIVSLLLSGSRTSLISIVIFLLFNKLRYLSNSVAILLFIGLVFSYEILISNLPAMIEYLGFAEYFRLDTIEEGSGRFIAWNFAWIQIQNVFFAGGGFGHTEYIFTQFYNELSRLGHQGNAHHSFLTIWLDTGLIGIVLFALGLFRSVYKSIGASPYALPIIFSILFSAFFESWLAASLNPFTSLFLIALTLMMTKDSQNSNDQTLDE